MGMTIPELDEYINSKIQGVFSQSDMAVLKEEIEKLEPGMVYVEIGVNEGKSARVAHEYADPEVYKFWIDPYDVVPHPASIGRAPWFEQEKMVGHDIQGFYIHGDADEFANFVRNCFQSNYIYQNTSSLKINRVPFVNLLFIDGHHDYDSVKKNTLLWEGLVLEWGTILFHDYDHPDVKRWIDEHYPPSKIEVLHNKIVRIRK